MPFSNLPVNWGVNLQAGALYDSVAECGVRGADDLRDVGYLLVDWKVVAAVVVEDVVAFFVAEPERG